MVTLSPKQTGLPTQIYVPRRGECDYCDCEEPHIHIMGNSKKTTPIRGKTKKPKSGKATKPVILKENPVAKSLSNPAFRPKRINSGKLYKRKGKKSGKIEAD